jgi:Zn-dependent M28 family amino/carboxypeptidase
LYASGTYHNPGLRPALEPLTRERKAKLLFGHDTPEEGKDDWTRSSDHGPFHAAGIPFIYFGVEDHEGYHTPADDFSDITPDFYVAATNVILDAVQLLDASITSNAP